MKSDALPSPDPSWALFLDVDGTLIEIATAPDRVRVDPAVVPILAALSEALGGALALVSGRPVDQLDALFAPLKLPTAGLHGAELRTAGAPLRRHDSTAGGLDLIRRDLAAFAGQNDGILLEDKGIALALHFRQAPDLARAAERAVETVMAAHGEGLQLLRGKMVFEIKPAAVDKGRVVDTFMNEPTFAGRRPVFIGDDVTDEDGFAAVNRRDGHSIRVGDGAETAAKCRVDSVDGLLAWLFAMPAALANGTDKAPAPEANA